MSQLSPKLISTRTKGCHMKGISLATAFGIHLSSTTCIRTFGSSMYVLAFLIDKSHILHM